MDQKAIELRIGQLDEVIAAHPEQEKNWMERGNLYWKIQDWNHCIADFDQAIAINPQSAAVELRRSVMQIISYYYKDVYNP